MKTPQHLTLSVNPKGKVHFVVDEGGWVYALCGLGAPLRGWTYKGWPAIAHDPWNQNQDRPVTCKRCLVEMKKRGWDD